MAPKLSKTPGSTSWAGPEIGSFNKEIFENILGIDASNQKILKDEGVI